MNVFNRAFGGVEAVALEVKAIHRSVLPLAFGSVIRLGNVDGGR